MNASRHVTMARTALVGAFAAMSLFAASTHAGGPLTVINHTPVIYPNGGANITLNLDQGGLGTRSNSQMTAVIQSAIAMWNGVGTSTLRLSIGAPLMTDYTAANYGSVMGNTGDGLNPVIYDTDGSITDAVFGTGQKQYFLGFAGSSYSTQGTTAGAFLEGYAILNGALNPTDAQLLTVATHEIGHMVGLDHAQLDNTHGLTPDNFVLMYPVIYRTQPTLHEDDVAAITALYPAANVNDYYGVLEGTFTTATGAPVLGANIWVRDDTSGRVYSVVSDFLMQGSGYFRMRLPPGTYALHAESINGGFKGTASVGPYAETASDASFQVPHPIAPVALGGAAPKSFTISAGCTATATFALDGAGNVSAGCAQASAPPGATIVANPYGAITVQGATLAGNTISNLQPNAVIQLGSTPGSAGSIMELQLNGLNIAAGSTLTIRSGASGQRVFLHSVDGVTTRIGGMLVAASGSGTSAAPELYVVNAQGITIASGGVVVAPSGLTMDTLATSATTGQVLRNDGVIDGGVYLDVNAGTINGGGAFKGNTMVLATVGNINNPVNGARYLDNGIQLHPASGDTVALTLNAYGGAPQFLNVAVHGNASLWMPSAWPSGSRLLPNNRTAPPGASQPAGVAEPAFGGGSMIVQATGTLALFSGPTNDFAFAGGIVLKSASTLDLKGVTINNGWTAAGRAFQGVFFEAPSIVSSGNINVLTNNLNWVNFSTRPQAPVRTWQLAPGAGGNLSFAVADSAAPHLNTFSLITEAAAAGQCYTCVMQLEPANLY